MGRCATWNTNENNISSSKKNELQVFKNVFWKKITNTMELFLKTVRAVNPPFLGMIRFYYIERNKHSFKAYWISVVISSSLSQKSTASVATYLQMIWNLDCLHFKISTEPKWKSERMVRTKKHEFSLAFGRLA